MTDDKLAELKRHYGRQFDSYFNISLKHSYLQAQVPFVATSAFDSCLTEWELRDSQVRWEKSRETQAINEAVHVKPYQLPPDMLAEVFFGGPFVRFAFVCDPFERILAAYLDQILLKQAPARPVFAQFGLDMNQPDSRVDFAQFLDFLETTGKNKRRWHPSWRPMAAILRPEVIAYDIIGRMERFEEDAGRVNAALGNALILKRAVAPKAGNARDQLADHYTEPLRDKVRALYARDFARFRYAKSAGGERK
jgi:hypothetical protein